MALPEGTTIRAIGNGTIVVYDDATGYGELVVVIEHDLGREYAFVNAYSETVITRTILSIYGHLRSKRNRGDAYGLTWQVGQSVKVGDVIGYVNDDLHNGDGAEHLHMGIRLSGQTDAERVDPGFWFRGYEKTTDQGKYFASAHAVIQTHFAYNPSTEVQARCQGTVCWTPTTSSCEDADTRYRLGNNLFAQLAGMEACTEAQEQLFSIADGPNPQERVPEDSLWQRFWRAVRNVFGETVSAADIRDFGTINTINVYTGNVVAGNASKAVYGAGQGYPVTAVTPPTPVPPDFIVNRTWLTTPWGTETYRYGLNESFDTKAQAKNIGEGTCPTQTDEPTTITGHFYLSRGYKEDPHSGDSAWRRIDSTITQCDNLKPGDTHTETKNTVIREWITMPGIYNVVYCIDHPEDDHNNPGDHKEKHESNNCSTEAVFEVVAGTVNVPDVDLTVSGFTLLQAPTYAGDFIRLGATITNQGTVNATTDIRSAYTVSCNGGSNILLTDDGTMASTLTAGASAWEETLSPVQLPNVVGTCTLSFFADYQGAQPETDETNNSASLTVTLAPRPAPQPDFIVRAVGPAGGSASIKAGSKFYPAMYVKNVGTAPSPAAIRSAYWFMGPGTSGTWTYITDDGTEASKLCISCEEREQYDGGMKISVRGTYYFKGCADYQSAVVESNENNNCTVSSPITVY